MTISEPIKLDDYWPYQVVVLADLIAKHTTSVLKKHGNINLSQWRVLAAVADKEGRTSAEVVTVTPMDKGIVSRATATLVDNGILEKVTDTEDRRRARLYLTSTGRDIYARIALELSDRNSLHSNPSEFNKELTRLIDRLRSQT